MRELTVRVLATALALCAAPSASAGVISVFWNEADAPVGQTAWDLYASVTEDTTVLNADLGDEQIDLPPDGVNTGLFSNGGAILGSSFVTLGGANVQFARALTITPSGSGSMVDAAWFFALGVDPEFDAEDGYRVWLGRFFVNEGVVLGGALGGPDRDIQSRIFIGWEDDAGAGLGVYDIPRAPAPGAVSLLALLALTSRRGRRRGFAGRESTSELP